jgi:hypothetical protein
MARYIDADKLPKNKGVLDTGFSNKMPICFVYIDDIEKAPTADVVEVRHCEWIEDEYSEKPCVCSYCGKEAQYVSTFEETFDYDWEENLQSTGYEEHREYIKTQYCPNCGAKMVGKDINVPTNGRSDT